MNDSDRHRLEILRGDPTRHDTGFSGDECTESYLLKDYRNFCQDDQRILQEGFGSYYVPGLTPKFMYSMLCREFDIAGKYAEIALREDVRNFSLEKRQDRFFRERPGEPLLGDDDIQALDAFTESKGVDIRQFVHRLVLIEPTSKNKMMFTVAFTKAIKSARSFSDLAKANLPDVRWIPGLEGLRINLRRFTEQAWFGRVNMPRYRKMLLSKILELLQETIFEDCFKVVCEYSGYKHDRCASGCGDDGDISPRLIRLGGRQNLIDKMFRSCLSMATFEECLKVYTQVHNERVSALAIIQMEKLAKTAEHHWTIAQIAYRRKNTKLWKRHLKKAAAKA